MCVCACVSRPVAEGIGGDDASLDHEPSESGFMPFEKALSYARALKLAGRKEWRVTKALVIYSCGLPPHVPELLTPSSMLFSALRDVT